MIAAYIIACIAIELTPGPNMAWLAILSMTSGRRAGMLAVAGVATGLVTIGLAAALGAAGLITSSPLAWQVLRWTGVAYLLYLAFDILGNGDPANGPQRQTRFGGDQVVSFDAEGFMNKTFGTHRVDAGLPNPQRVAAQLSGRTYHDESNNDRSGLSALFCRDALPGESAAGETRRHRRRAAPPLRRSTRLCGPSECQAIVLHTA